MSDEAQPSIAKKRIFYIKGKTKEDLKKLSNEEVLKIIGARGRRSLKRGLTKAQQDLNAKVDEANKLIEQGKEPKEIKTHCRNAIIVPKMFDLTIKVHNGKIFEKIIIKTEMIGHYLGEFVLTRKKVVHGKGGSVSSAEAEAK